MAESAVIVEENKNIWEGGQSPMKVSYGKLMMWVFPFIRCFHFFSFTDHLWFDPL